MPRATSSMPRIARALPALPGITRKKGCGRAARTEALSEVPGEDIEAEKKRLYQPLYVSREKGMGWKELNMAIAKAMQNYCGGVKCETLLREGLDLLALRQRSFQGFLRPTHMN